MRLWRYTVIILVTCGLLQGCANVRMAQELQSSRVTFDSGDFKKAFHQLLPLAAEGSPEAQYAVGYMYYYGYGVSQDNESGLFWIHRSASKDYPPAIKALKLIDEQQNRSTHPSRSTPSSYSNYSLKQSLNDTIVEPNKKTASDDTPKLKASRSLHAKKDDDEIMSTLPKEPLKVTQTKEDTEPSLSSATTQTTPPSNYTLQLFGSYNLETVKTLQIQLNQLGSSTRYAQTERDGRDWFVLTYGAYPALYRAILAKDDLPKDLKQLKPWVRPTHALRWMA